ASGVVTSGGEGTGGVVTGGGAGAASETDEASTGGTISTGAGACAAAGYTDPNSRAAASPVSRRRKSSARESRIGNDPLHPRRRSRDIPEHEHDRSRRSREQQQREDDQDEFSHAQLFLLNANVRPCRDIGSLSTRHERFNQCSRVPRAENRRLGRPDGHGQDRRRQTAGAAP